MTDCDIKTLGKIIGKYLKYILCKHISVANTFQIQPFIFTTPTKIARGFYYSTILNKKPFIVDLSQIFYIQWFALNNQSLINLPKIKLPYCFNSIILGKQLQTLRNKQVIIFGGNIFPPLIDFQLIDSNKYVTLLNSPITNQINEITQTLIPNSNLDYIMFDPIPNYQLLPLPYSVECTGNLQLQNELCKYINKNITIGFNTGKLGTPPELPIKLLDVNSYLLLGLNPTGESALSKLIIVPLSKIVGFFEL